MNWPPGPATFPKIEIELITFFGFAIFRLVVSVITEQTMCLVYASLSGLRICFSVLLSWPLSFYLIALSGTKLCEADFAVAGHGGSFIVLVFGPRSECTKSNQSHHAHIFVQQLINRWPPWTR